MRGRDSAGLHILVWEHNLDLSDPEVSRLLARRSEIEEAINTDFGHRSRHETAMMELLGVVQGIDYLQRNLRRFMRPTRRRSRPNRSISSTCPRTRCSSC